MSSRRFARAVFAALATLGRSAGTAALLSFAAPWAAGGQAATVPSNVTLADALRAAAEHNPALRAAELDVLAVEQRSRQAGARPNPELTLELENFAGSGDFSGADSLESTLALSQLVELGGKRGSRIDAADGELEVARVEQAIRRLDLQAEVTRRFVRLVADQEQLALARRATQLAREFESAVARRVAAARSPVAEESRARIALGRAELEEANASRILEASRRNLAATWGDAAADFLAAQADLQRLPAVASFDALVERLPANPDLRRYLSEERLRDAELRLARARRTPDVIIAAGVRRFVETGDNAFVLSFSVPLPVADRNQGAIAESRLRFEKASADRPAALLDAQARLFALYQELLQARAEFETLETRLVPLARAALEQTVSGYERGRFSYLEVAEAQRELTDLQHAQIEAAASYHLVLSEIERLTSEPLAATGQQGERT
jgi:cobalt-zinc-cadmium efflux system outer membrane protein